MNMFHWMYIYDNHCVSVRWSVTMDICVNVLSYINLHGDDYYIRIYSSIKYIHDKEFIVTIFTFTCEDFSNWNGLNYIMLQAVNNLIGIYITFT